jgi:hypothetical protein
VLTPTVEAVICVSCGKTQATKATPKGELLRAPRGWKKREEALYCQECWRAKYILRAISVPVASPQDCSWEELRKALRTAWAQTTACANRIMTECYARDVRRKPGDEKMPPMPRVYLYPELRQEFPDLASQTVASLEQACQRKYRASRYQIVWTAAAALPTYRYPTPYPVPAQGWTISIEQERPVASLALPHGGEAKRVQLRLKGGPQFRRQTGQIKSIVAGDAVRGEAAIYQAGDTLMVKLVAWLPREKQQDRTGRLIVKTAPDCLLVAINAKDEALWRYNGDHLRRWIAEHRKQLQRWSEDAKYENRPVPNFAERRQAAARKYRQRMNSATHEIAAQLAGYAARRRFAAVEYDDNERSYAPDLPWYRLAALIREKVEERGMEFIARGPLAPETGEALAKEEDAE